ncbi:MAG: toxin, BrnA family [Methyloprofundus sp.]|nr:MAG: toxin, BrnA family [Methyloprofundus sp.]
MKLQEITYEWDDDKNNLLKSSDRKISFEEVVFALKNERLLDIISSPTHRNQECLVLNINSYVYIVPFVQEGNRVFLKTIYPSRKHTKHYLIRHIL